MRYAIYFFFGVFLLSCGSKDSTSVTGSINESLEPSAFKSKIEATPDGVVLDVRTPEEVSQGIIAGAKQLDFKDADFEQQVNALDKEKTYFVYCASGGRSGKATTMMNEKGFTKVYTLEGGLTAWKEQGLETVSP